MSFAGKAPKVNRLRLQPLSADPVNPAEGDMQYSDGTARSEGVWVYKNGSWSQVGSAASASSIISGDDASLEGSLGAWVTYADAAGDKPVDGTAGSATLTATRTTTGGEVLNGDASLKLTKDAANRQGEGASLDVAVPLYLRGKPAKLSFVHQASVDFDYGTFLSSADYSDIVMYLYDVTNSTLLTPNVVHLDSSGFSETQVYIPLTCASIRVILHVATTSALAYTLLVDDVSLKLDSEVDFSAISDWETFTPTTTFTTNVTWTGRKRRIGENLEVQVTGAAIGAVGTPGALIHTLPDSLVIDTLKLSSTTLGYYSQNLGLFSTSDVTATFDSRDQGFTRLLSDTTIGCFGLVYAQAGSHYLEQFDHTTLTLASGDFIHFSYTVPIKGWTSGHKTASSVGVNVPAIMVANKASGATTANTPIATWTNTLSDTVSGFNATTGVYTVKVPGSYSVHIVNRNTGTAAHISIRKNGAIFAAGIHNSPYHVTTCIIPDLIVGDQITVTPNATMTCTATATDTVLSIQKIETPQATVNVRKIAYIKDEKASGTAGGGFTSGSYLKRDLNTLTGDTSFVSLASSVFTLQPGTYRIKASAPSHLVVDNKIRLQNTTDATTAIVGTNSYNGSGAVSMSRSHLEGQIVISAAKTFEIQHRCSVTRAVDGFGNEVTFGDNEVYTMVEIEKLL